MKKTLLFLLSFGVTGAFCQLNIQSGATFIIQGGAIVTVQGDVVSQSNIQGAGKLQLKGSSLQSLNMNGNTIETVLEVDNAQNVNLTGISRLNNQLLLTAGKLQLGNFDFVMSPTATHSGADVNKFVRTNGTGSMKQEVIANTSFVMPVGNASYNPLNVNIAGASGFASASISGRAVGAEHPQKHPRSSDFLEHYWKVARTGITGGTIGMVGTYQNDDITGTEPPIRSFLWDGGAWAFGTAQDNAANTVSANMTANDVELYAMNRFVLASPKAFLEGAYDVNTGLMKDLLRNSGAYAPNTLPVSNLLPTTDPYRSAPLSGSASFAHVGNTIPEAVTSSAVFNDLNSPANQIVDWVFVEARTQATPGTVLQTRSALVQRDGDIVDIDGVSPVYFKDVDAGSYVLVVKHRNHTAMSQNGANPIALGLSSVVFDFTDPANTAILGTSNVNYSVRNNKNLLWSGNASLNNNVRFGGPANDKDYILATGLSGTAATVLSNVYNVSDVNMNRNVRFGGPSNDKDYILSTPLGGLAATVRTQILPN